MPSLANDKAVATAKEKVDEISNLHNKLSPKKKQSPKLAASSSPSCRRYPDYSSPLFRDEVVQQEMRYFDEVLRADNKVGGFGYNLPAYKPTFGKRVEEGSKHNMSSPKQRQSSSPYRPNTSSLPASHQHQQRAKKRHVRSRNIRQQTNRKLLLKAKVSSRRIMRKLSGIGQTCSQKWGVVTNAIHQQILLSIASMNSLLENNGASGRDCRQRSSFGEAVARSQHQRESSTSNHNAVHTNNVDSSSSRGGLSRVPPQLFMDTTTWFKNRTESISSKAIAKAKDSIRNRKVSFLV